MSWLSKYIWFMFISGIISVIGVWGFCLNLWQEISVLFVDDCTIIMVSLIFQLLNENMASLSINQGN